MASMTINYPNGDRYDGPVFFYNNIPLPHGQGTKTFANGDIQTAIFIFGRANGRGCFQTLDGDFYRGQYRDGHPDGEGESYQARKHRRYKGTFQRGVESGQGVITIGEVANCDFKRYEGQVLNGKRHGTGKLYIKQPGDGEIASLEGTWTNDVLSGPGKQISPTGQCFQGDFVNGYLEGKGTCKNAGDGKTYEVVFTRGVVTTWNKEVK